MKSSVVIFLVFVLCTPQNAQGGALPQELFVQQECSNSCTLSAAVMMIRSCLYRGGSNCWVDVTESTVRGSAWTDAGLSWDWHYAIEDNTVTVAHESVSGADEQMLIELLQEHPEGIMLYCGGSVHHGVFLFDYADGTFYCADPAVGFSGERMELADSLLGERAGSQEEILRCVTAYWYISNREIIPDAEPLPIAQNQP